MESKQKQYPFVDVTGDRSKIWCCKEQYCIGTWNVRSMNQGKFSSVQFSHSVMSDSLRPHESQHARPPCPTPTPRAYPNSCPFSQWCHPTISCTIPSFFLKLFLHWSPVAYWAPTDLGEFLFQYPIILPFHTVHGVLKARILKWFAIPFSSKPCFVRTLHHDPSILGSS